MLEWSLMANVILGATLIIVAGLHWSEWHAERMRQDANLRVGLLDMQRQVQWLIDRETGKESGNIPPPGPSRIVS